MISIERDEQRETLGWLAQRCRRCGVVRPAEVVARLVVWNVGGLDVKRRPRVEAECDLCGDRRPAEASVDRWVAWDEAQGLPALVAATAPHLVLDESRALDDEQVLLLLQAIDRRAQPPGGGQAMAKLGAFVGAGIGLVGFAIWREPILALIPWLKLALAVTVGIPALLVAGIGWLVGRRRLRRAVVRERLVQAMARWRLRIDRLHDLAVERPGVPRRIAALVAEMRRE